MVSHDLRSPLFSIATSAELMLSASTPEDFWAMQKSVERISRSAAKMEGLISDLLDRTKIESGTLTLHVEKQDARELVEKALDVLRPLAQQRASISEAMSQRTFDSNAIVNASARFSPIWSATPSSSRPKGERSRCVQRLTTKLSNSRSPTRASGFRRSTSPIFSTVTGSRKHRQSGLGLGLAIVKGLVEAHGGRVWLESQRDKGTTFYFAIPPDGRIDCASALMPGAASSPSILVVDDDADIRVSIAEILEDRGYTVFSAGDGREALDRLRTLEVRPAAILLDIMMPVMDGFAFRAEQEKDPALSAIPVVVFSAYGNVAQSAATLKAAGHLKKPLRAEALLETIRRIVQPSTSAALRSS